MTRIHHRTSAEIIEFPRGGRRGLTTPSEIGGHPIEAPCTRPAHIASDCGWYHDEAIEEDAHKH